ncbi:prolactin-like [Erethizon dorsatum]
MVLMVVIDPGYPEKLGLGTLRAGSLLLLVMSTLVLCQNVASHRTCHDDSGCHLNLHDLYHVATYMSQTMHFQALDLFQEFEKQYSKNSLFFVAAIKRCHTADILAPAGKEEARLMQRKELINLVVRYLLSWKDPLLHLGLEARRLPKFQYFVILKVWIISLKYQQLQELTRQIANELDVEVPDKVDYAVWLEGQSLQSSDEEPRLFAVYNTLRCFVHDAQNIDFLLSFLKCQADNEGTC